VRYNGKVLKSGKNQHDVWAVYSQERVFTKQLTAEADKRTPQVNRPAGPFIAREEKHEEGKLRRKRGVVSGWHGDVHILTRTRNEAE